MKELDIKTKTVNVTPRVIQTDYKIIEETPDFGITRSAWPSVGIENEEQYAQWQEDMKKQWNEKRKTN